MISFSRNSRSIFANWWWTIDKVLLLMFAIVIVLGAFLTFSASPSVANRIGYGSFHFVKKQMLFLPAAVAGMLFLSMLSLKNIRRIAILGYAATILLMFLTLFIGVENKGATRWISIFGFQLQPSEFVKPLFVMVAALLFEAGKKYQDFPGMLLSAGLYVLTAVLLLAQPDIGMCIVVSVIWCFQLFLAGLPLAFVWLLAGAGLVGAVGIYVFFPHAQARIVQLFSSELSYQVKKAMAAFENGGWFGVGPGEGVAKLHIPDAHTDFIFAVAAEEYGMVFCLIIVGLFAAIVIRTMLLSCRENNLFIILASSGLVASFGLQAIINMASTLHIAPTKGMALPFISYGGSALLGTAIGMGMLLAITRKNVHAEDKDEEY